MQQFARLERGRYRPVPGRKPARILSNVSRSGPRKEQIDCFVAHDEAVRRSRLLAPSPAVNSSASRSITRHWLGLVSCASSTRIWSIPPSSRNRTQAATDLSDRRSAARIHRRNPGRNPRLALRAPYRARNASRTGAAPEPFRQRPAQAASRAQPRPAASVLQDAASGRCCPVCQTARREIADLGAKILGPWPSRQTATPSSSSASPKVQGSEILQLGPGLGTFAPLPRSSGTRAAISSASAQKDLRQQGLNTLIRRKTEACLQRQLLGASHKNRHCYG